MPATTNKQQVLTHLQTALRKKFSVPTEPGPRPVLEELVYAICREGVPTDQADTAFAKLHASFFDWNEVRVSSVQEVSDALVGLPDAGTRAERIVGLLQEVFEERYAFDLSSVAKKGLKDAARQIARYKTGVNDFSIAWVTQRTLGGHAIPLDRPTLRVLRRLTVVDAEEDDPEAVRGSLEHYIPKAKGYEFTETVIQFADQVCQEEPQCPGCPIRTECPTGQARLAKSKADNKAAAKPKPKSR